MSKYTWIWCAINSIAIVLVILAFNIRNDYDHIQDNSISEIKSDIQAIKYRIEKSDTIIVNINQITPKK